MKPNSSSLFLAFILVFIVTGCGTILNGTTQRIDVASHPSDGRVYADGRFCGTTPVAVTLDKNQDHVIRIAKVGYQPVEVLVRKKLSAVIYLNLPFLCFIGCAVDWGTGGAYVLSLDRIEIDLEGRGDKSQ